MDLASILLYHHGKYGNCKKLLTDAGNVITRPCTYILRQAKEKAMEQILGNAMLALIFGSVCCMLIGVITTAVRIIKLIRRERIMANRMWQDLQAKEVNTVRS